MVFFIIAHITFLLVVAFFILFAASKADGLLALFGRLLGFWLVLLAILHLVAVFVPRVRDMMHAGAMPPGDMMHGHWMHPWHPWEGQPSSNGPAPLTPPRP